MVFQQKVYPFTLIGEIILLKTFSSLDQSLIVIFIYDSHDRCVSHVIDDGIDQIRFAGEYPVDNGNQFVIHQYTIRYLALKISS